MRDFDIRSELKRELLALCADDPDTIVVEEFGLSGGAARADLAVVNGNLKGYEIKSNSDTLKRLERQSAIYSKVFDTMTLVTEERHLKGAMKIVPVWWGVQIAEPQASGMARLHSVRPERKNPGVLSTELVQLLWRDEVLNLLSQYFPDGKLARKPRRLLWQALVQSVSLPELKDLVRKSLKSRDCWRLDAAQNSDDEKSRLSSRSLSSRIQLDHSRSRRYTHRPN